jgi:hypothetical protein
MIINIRGTNGSGKSTVVKKFLQRFPHVELFGALGPRRPEAYKVRLPNNLLYVVGPYQSLTGGIDALPLNSVEIVTLLDKYRKLGHVMFEGVVISTYHGAVGEWLVQHKTEAKVVYLDTKLEVCLEAIASRGTVQRGTKNVEAKVKMVQRTKERFDAAGVPTELLSRSNAVDTIREWLR